MTTTSKFTKKVKFGQTVYVENVTFAERTAITEWLVTRIMHREERGPGYSDVQVIEGSRLKAEIRGINEANRDLDYFTSAIFVERAATR